MKKIIKKQKLNINEIISKTVAAVHTHTHTHTHTIHLNNILKKVLNKIMTIIKYGKTRDKCAPLLSHILLWLFSVF